MTKRSRGDFNQTAYQVMLESTGQVPKRQDEPERLKNPAAVALDRLGGLKGGKARAAKLTPRKRSQMAAKAATSRWRKKAMRQSLLKTLTVSLHPRHHISNDLLGAFLPIFSVSVLANNRSLVRPDTESRFVTGT